MLNRWTCKPGIWRSNVWKFLHVVLKLPANQWAGQEGVQEPQNKSWQAADGFSIWHPIELTFSYTNLGATLTKTCRCWRIVIHVFRVHSALRREPCKWNLFAHLREFVSKRVHYTTYFVANVVQGDFWIRKGTNTLKSTHFRCGANIKMSQNVHHTRPYIFDLAVHSLGCIPKKMPNNNIFV